MPARPCKTGPKWPRRGTDSSFQTALEGQWCNNEDKADRKKREEAEEEKEKEEEGGGGEGDEKEEEKKDSSMLRLAATYSADYLCSTRTHREIGAALDGGVVSDNDALDTGNHTDARDHPPRRNGAIFPVEVVASQRRELKESRPEIDSKKKKNIRMIRTFCVHDIERV